MLATVLFVQGAGDMDHPQGSGHLARWLDRALGDDVRVVAPVMPDAENPAHEPWAAAIADHLARIDGPLVIVGHSFGASTVLKLLSEAAAPASLLGIFLVETPWWEPEGWSAEYALREDFADRLPDVPIHLYHSADDPEVPRSHLDIYTSSLPRAVAREIPGAEHSFVNGLPALADDIQAMLRAGA